MTQRSSALSRLFHIQLYIALYTVPGGLFHLAHMEEFTSEESVQRHMGIIAGSFKGWEECVCKRESMSVRGNISCNTFLCIHLNHLNPEEKKIKEQIVKFISGLCR